MCSIQFQTLLPNCIILSEGEVSPTSGNSEQQVHQMSTGMDLKVSFKQILINLRTYLKLNQNITQNSPHNQTKGLLEVYKYLIHCPIAFPFFLKYMTNV